MVLPPVITLDGLSGAGKGTIGLRLARCLSWHYLDSGVLYRLLALEATRLPALLTDDVQLINLAHQMTSFLSFKTNEEESNLRVIWQEEDITHLLRTETCAIQASKIAANLSVRHALLAVQRSFQRNPGLVADGRDMGQVIFPLAICKFFLTASLEERIKRRQKQLKQQGNYASLSAIKNAIVQRDESDQTRLEASLQATQKAFIIDTTALSVEQVMTLIKKKLSTIGLYFH